MIEIISISTAVSISSSLPYLLGNCNNLSCSSSAYDGQSVFLGFLVGIPSVLTVVAFNVNVMCL